MFTSTSEKKNLKYYKLNQIANSNLT